MKKTLKIDGMHCHSCEVLLSDVIEETGARVLSANQVKGEIVIDVSEEQLMPEIKKAVEKEGYRVI